jgi:hypothetical protein
VDTNSTKVKGPPAHADGFFTAASLDYNRTSQMAHSSTEKIFAGIYARNSWRDPESRSGTGSSVARTEQLRPRLTQLLLHLRVGSVLDLPCGDFNWMRLTELPGIEYLGADVVTPLIARNNLLYASPGRRFLRLDMLSDALPKADLILCRDGLVHLSFFDIARTLKRMQDGGATYLLTTTFTAHGSNKDAVTGDWRPLNLDLAPFRFPVPLKTLADGPRPDGTYPDKTLALYRFTDLSQRVLELQQLPRKRLVLPWVLRRALSRARTALRPRPG